MTAPEYNPKDRLKNLLVLTIGLLLVSFVFESIWPSSVAIVIAVVGVAIPVAGDAIIKAWLKFGQFMGHINSRILLTLVFYVYLVPMSFVYRLKHPKALDIRPNNKTSLFHERNHKFTKQDLEKTW